MQAVCCHEQSCLEDYMTFIMTSYCQNKILSRPTFNVGGLCEILCKVIRDEGVWEQRQTQKTWSLNVGEELFPAFLSKKMVYFDVWGFISEASRLYSEILADTNLKTQIQSKSWVVYQVIDNQGWLLQYFGWLRMNRLHQPYLELITQRKVITSSLWNMLCLWSETGMRFPPRISVMKSLHLYL